MKLERTFNRYYSAANDFYHEYNFQISNQLDYIPHLLKSDSHLDLGCGEVPFCSYYHKYNIQYKTTDLVRNSSSTIDFILLADWTSLPFNSSSFSSIALFDVLEHLPADITALYEIHRILIPNWYLVATIPFLYCLHEFPFDYRRYKYSGIIHLLDATSFDPVVVQSIIRLLLLSKH